MALDSKIPKGPIADKWTDYKNHINLVNPANKRNIDIIVVGTGRITSYNVCYTKLLRPISPISKVLMS